MNEPLLDLASVQVDPACLLRVPADFARQHRVLPLYAPGGCLACAGRGFRGRMGLFELFRPDAETAEAIAEGATEGTLRRLHAERGGKMLRDDGRAKCLAGLTTAREVGRVA